MFLPPQKKIIFVCAGILICFATELVAQQAEFDRRMAALQQARQRGPEINSYSATGNGGMDYTAPPPPVASQAQARVASLPPQQVSGSMSRPAAGNPVLARSIPVNQLPATTRQRNRVQSYLPKHLRVAQIPADVVTDTGSPIIEPQTMAPMMGSPTPMTGSPMMGNPAPMMQQTIVDSGQYYDGCVDGSCGGCDTCGNVGTSYFSDPCCGRSSCPPGPCWVTGLGQLISNGEFFAGANAFRSTLFSTPGGAAGQLSDDSSYGFYQGMNFGLPLCRISCGLFSGQFGFRTTQTNFDGSLDTSADREQLFVTGGFFRRVDYGMQYGVVFDYLNDEWFSDAEVVQLRGEIGYVYSGGTTFGFRFATNLQDDFTNATFGGNTFTNLNTTTDDNYRFFVRYDAPNGGFGDFFAGWSESDQAIIGLDSDLPLTNRLSMQAGFNYYLSDQGLPAGAIGQGGNAGEAYNIYVGIAFRPRGREFYRSYERPLFPVADNGSMLIQRN
ncbi:MAG: DUF6666 family protein [Planctomycetota bacterium]